MFSQREPGCDQGGQHRRREGLSRNPQIRLDSHANWRADKPVDGLIASNSWRAAWKRASATQSARQRRLANRHLPVVACSRSARGRPSACWLMASSGSMPAELALFAALALLAGVHCGAGAGCRGTATRKLAKRARWRSSSRSLRGRAAAGERCIPSTDLAGARRAPAPARIRARSGSRRSAERTARNCGRRRAAPGAAPQETRGVRAQDAGAHGIRAAPRRHGGVPLPPLVLLILAGRGRRASGRVRSCSCCSRRVSAAGCWRASRARDHE